ncbi:MAG: hypothetical protein EXR77_03015 [Myxococcales bacterium]|nr:hypothetical protein [Myxococcales bacterium]
MRGLQLVRCVGQVCGSGVWVRCVGQVCGSGVCEGPCKEYPDRYGWAEFEPRTDPAPRQHGLP